MSKERLESLKRNREWTEATGGKFYTVDSDDYKWLIEQAGRAKELEQQNKRYREAIKECVERMNAGGAGTRSFVYERLIEVLEGESNELG